MTQNGGNGASNGANGSGRRVKRPMLDMKVTQLMIDPLTSLPIVILKDVASETEAVPIWIGLAEASAIAVELENVALERPMTHDLMKNIIGEVGVTVERIEVHDFRDDIFYASIYLRAPGNRQVRVDSRPSDALALALRCGARICVARKVIDDARRLDKREGLEAHMANGHMNDDPMNNRHSADGHNDDGHMTPEPHEMSPGILEELDEKDFGKWKM